MFYDKNFQQVLYQQHASTASAIQHHHQQQQQRLDAMRDWTLTNPTSGGPHHHLHQAQIYPHWPPSAPPAMARISQPLQAGQDNGQKPYSGMDQLLLAASYAMMEGSYHPTSGVYQSAPPLQQPQQQQQQHHHILHPLNYTNRNQNPQSQPGLHSASITRPISPSPIPPSGSAPLSRQLARTPNSLYLPTGRGLGFGSQASDQSSNQNEDIDIPIPRSGSEAVLYKLLEGANLLNYFGTFLHYGGDDVQQLCDADEEEFLEIMLLVGMNRKPLHVRRLQRALEDWKREKKATKCELGQDQSSFKRPSLSEANINSFINRCSSPCGSRRSTHTSVTLDTASHPATPRSTSSQSFLLIPDDSSEARALDGVDTENNLNNRNDVEQDDRHKQHQHQRPHVLINAPKRLRLYNPAQVDRCKTT